MKTLKIMNGDIVLDAAGNPVLIEGIEMVEQDMAAWLLEPIGTDRLYPSFGSRLDDIIGDAILSNTQEDVISEVRRVVENYAAYKARMIASDLSSASGTDAVRDLVEIQSVSCAIERDSIRVMVSFKMPNGTSGSLVIRR